MFCGYYGAFLLLMTTLRNDDDIEADIDNGICVLWRDLHCIRLLDKSVFCRWDMVWKYRFNPILECIEGGLVGWEHQEQYRI